MRYEIEATTDTTAIVLFDPAAIPPPTGQGPTDAEEAMTRLERAGAACLIDPDPAGAALLHVYVDEPVPGPLLDHAIPTRSIGLFPIPSGQLRVTGMEELLRAEDRRAHDPPRAGGSVSLPPGSYRLRLYRLSLPERLVHDRFRAEASTPEYLAWVSMKVLIPLAVAAWIGLVAIVFTTVRVPYPDLAAPIFVLIFALPFVVRRLDVFAAARARFARLVREHPAWAVTLESRNIGPGSRPREQPGEVQSWDRAGTTDFR